MLRYLDVLGCFSTDVAAKRVSYHSELLCWVLRKLASYSITIGVVALMGPCYGGRTSSLILFRPDRSHVWLGAVRYDKKVPKKAQDQSTYQASLHKVRR